MNLVLLKYNFLFDPTETWTNLYQFEDQLKAFFAEHNMTAEIVKPIDGSGGDRIMLIKKVEEVMTTATQEPDKTIKQQKASLTANRGFDGRWKK